MRGVPYASDSTRNNYGVDMTALSETYEKEQREFFMNTSSWVDIHPSQLLGQPYTLKEFDMHTVRAHMHSPLSPEP